jgi:hypothetical protein
MKTRALGSSGLQVSADVELTPGDLAEIEDVAATIEVQGARYPSTSSG